MKLPVLTTLKNAYSGAAWKVLFSPRGKYLGVLGSFSGLQIFDTATWRIVQKLDYSDDEIRSFDFSGNEKQILLATGTKRLVKTGLIGANSFDFNTLTRHANSHVTDIFYLSSKKLAIVGDGIIYVQSSVTGEVLGRIASHRRSWPRWSVARSKNGSSVVTVEPARTRTINIWNMYTLRSVSSHYFPEMKRIYMVALHPNGREAAIRDREKGLFRLNLTNFHILEHIPLPLEVPGDIAYSINGDIVAWISGSEKSRLGGVLQEPRYNLRLLTIKRRDLSTVEGSAETFAFHPEGSLLAVADEHNVRILNIRSK